MRDYYGPLLYGVKQWARAFVGALLDSLRRRDSEFTQEDIVA